MQFIGSLAYQPVGALAGALSAPFTLNFASDANWTVSFNGGFQGDPVTAQSLKVDNSGNNTPITYTQANSTDIIPAYSIGYIDIRTFYGMSFTCPNGVSVNFEALNYYQQPGFAPASNVGSTLTNDPLFAKTVGIYHFDEARQSINFNDSSIGGYGLVSPNGTIGVLETDTTNLKFGAASLLSSGSGDALSANSITPKTSFTVEFWDYFTNLNTGASEIVSSGANYSITRNNDGSGRYIFVFGNSLNTFNFTAGNGKPLSQIYNTWHHIAMCVFGTTILMFYDGINQGTGRLLNAITLASAPLQIGSASNGIFQIDELRITNDARYTNNFSVPTAAPLNQ